MLSIWQLAPSFAMVILGLPDNAMLEVAVADMKNVTVSILALDNYEAFEFFAPPSRP